MSNTAARWTLVAALATTTILAAAVTSRLSAGPDASPNGTNTSQLADR